MSAKCPLFHSDLGAKGNQRKSYPLPLVSFGLSAASGRLRNSRFQHSNKSSPLSIFWLKPQARQGGLKVKTMRMQPLWLFSKSFTFLLRHSSGGWNPGNPHA
jgi:hypothetical protein